MNNNRSRSHTIFSCYVLVLGLTLVGYANADDDANAGEASRSVLAHVLVSLGPHEVGNRLMEHRSASIFLTSRALDTLSRAARTKALTIWWSIT